MWQIISNYIGILIFGIVEIIFARIILNKNIKTTKIKTIIILIVTSLLFTIISNYLLGTIKTLSIYLVHVFEFKEIFKISYNKSMFLSFLFIIVVIIADILNLMLITNVVGMNKLICYNEFAGSILSNIMVGIILIGITWILKKPFRKIMKTEVSNNIKIILLSIVTLACLIMFFYIFIDKFKNDENSLAYFSVMVVLSSILFSLITQTIKNSKLTVEYDKLLEFMKTYENEIENQRILRHEVKNEFRTIRAKICDRQGNKEIIEYIDEILKEKIIVKQEKYAKFVYLPANGIKGLCYFKVQEAENNGINVDINISKRIKESIIYDLNLKEERDFGRILGVVLDNAIEASKDSKKKQLGIEAYVNSNQEFKMIITNTYDNKIDKSKIGIDKFSTKGKNRGHGLLLVKQLTEKNNKFKIQTDIQENIYSQTIEIKKL